MSQRICAISLIAPPSPPLNTLVALGYPLALLVFAKAQNAARATATPTQHKPQTTNPRVRKRVKLEATKPQTLEIWKLSEEPSHDDAPARLFAFCCLVVFLISPATNDQEEDTNGSPKACVSATSFYCIARCSPNHGDLNAAARRSPSPPAVLFIVYAYEKRPKPLLAYLPSMIAMWEARKGTKSDHLAFGSRGLSNFNLTFSVAFKYCTVSS